MRFEGLDARFRVVVPDFDQTEKLTVSVTVELKVHNGLTDHLQ